MADKFEIAYYKGLQDSGKLDSEITDKMELAYAQALLEEEEAKKKSGIQDGQENSGVGQTQNQENQASEEYQSSSVPMGQDISSEIQKQSGDGLLNTQSNTSVQDNLGSQGKGPLRLEEEGVGPGTPEYESMFAPETQQEVINPTSITKEDIDNNRDQLQSFQQATRNDSYVQNPEGYSDTPELTKADKLVITESLDKNRSEIYRKEFLDKYSEINFTTDIDDIYSNCDVISLHLPHTKQTDKLINNIVINTKLKKQPIIINTARGKLIDPVAVISGIKNKLIKGYLCDVLDTEPILKNEILLGVENIIITPHVGSRTYENVQNQGLKSISNLINSLYD